MRLALISILSVMAFLQGCIVVPAHPSTVVVTRPTPVYVQPAAVIITRPAPRRVIIY